MTPEHYKKLASTWDSNTMVEYLAPRVHPWVLSMAAFDVCTGILPTDAKRAIEAILTRDERDAVGRLFAVLRDNANGAYLAKECTDSRCRAEQDRALCVQYLGSNVLALAEEAPWAKEKGALKASTTLAISYSCRVLKPDEINPPADLLRLAGRRLYNFFPYDPAGTKYRVILGQILCAENSAFYGDARQVAWDYAEEHDLPIVRQKGTSSAFSGLLRRRR